MIGSRVGHYEIIELLGVGGMGEVYRARDTTLDRMVAIKVLPAEWADDPERLGRLQREAKVLAQLEHTNIAAIHGLEGVATSGGRSQRLLVMQLAEGDTLSDWIGTPRLTTARALQIGLQIAAGLEAAHERGVVHRDLKPANVKVAEDAGGHPHVKLLDFGLAKAYEPDGSVSNIAPELSASPTELAATRTGVILGTAAYMSPEQARGKQVDKRADIWAFGVVMYEMLTGHRLFDGESVSDMIAGVLKTDPDFSALPADLPPRVVRMLKRCLVKDPTKRLRDIGEARLVLESPVDAAAPAPPSTGGATRGVDPASATAAPSTVARAVPWAVAVLAFIVATWALMSRPVAQAPSFELAVGPPPDSDFLLGTNLGNVVVSPDGTKIAFVATTEEQPRLFVRPLNRDEPVALPGTEDAYYPFWSADSTQLAFFAAGSLKRVDISGGLPETIAEAENGRGGSWGADGIILFTPRSAGTVARVAASGGEVVNVTNFDDRRGENAHYWPYILPGAERFLYFARSESSENSGIYLARIDGASPPVRVVASMSSGIYAPPHDGRPGYLLWVRDTNLLAQQLDPATGELEGSAAVIATDVRVEDAQRGLLASVSDSGVLAWAIARAADNVADWYDRQGLVTGRLDIEPGAIQQVALSEDGNRLLFSRPMQGTSDIFLHDVAAGTTRAVVAAPGFEELPVWSSDGTRFLYADTVSRVVLADPDGIAEERVIVGEDIDAGGGFLPSPDDKYLLLQARHPDGPRALAAVSMEDPGDPVFLAPPATPPDFPSDFSPDGRWLLLSSARSGEVELYATRWIVEGDQPRLGEPWVQVSSGTNGAAAARWTTGGEIIYIGADNRVVAVPVTQSGNGLDLGRERRLFPVSQVNTGFMDVSSDGQRFVVTGAPYAERQTLRILTNWYARLPAGGR